MIKFTRFSELQNIEKALIGLCALSVVLLIASFDQRGRDYFTLMRFVVFCTGALAGWHFKRADNIALAVLLGATALLFNPFIPLGLQRQTWEPIDIGASIVLAVAAVQVWRMR